MADKKSPTVIRVYKKKHGGHDGHHGGAWKVAYADFVTAMMAFFLVMWLISMQPDVRDAVQGYFNNPVGFKQAYSSGDNPAFDRSPASATLAFLASVRRKTEREQLEATAERLREALEESPDLKDFEGEFDVSVGDDGLRIELLDSGRTGTYFASGEADPLAPAIEAIEVISAELAKLPHPIILEGHTDARPLDRVRYTNWELSTDRAHAARRLLVQDGIRADRFLEVRGYADRRLRDRANPFDPSNRRISILLPFQTDAGNERGVGTAGSTAAASGDD